MDQHFGSAIDKWFVFKMVICNVNYDTAVKFETFFIIGFELGLY